MALGNGHKKSYSVDVRDFCITLKNIHLAAYRFVRHEFNDHLPHVGTIVSWHAESDINCKLGILIHVFEILQHKVSEKGEKLIGSFIFDEVAIRKHIQYVNGQLLGFENIPGIDLSQADIATEALVFMFNAINDDLCLPIAYYFVTKKVDAPIKMKLVGKLLNDLLNIGIELSNVTFDGFKTNPCMCRLFGANLDVYSEEFKPSFTIGNKEIGIIFDVSHCMKLSRNTLATKETFYDENNEIKWEYIEKLVIFKDDRNFDLSHKLTQAHIQWEKNPMNVRLAVQIFSASTADSIEFLMNQGYPEFAGAEGTIKFIRTWNDLFDVLNSSDDTKKIALKNRMGPSNANQISELFRNACEYIRGLQVVQNAKKIQLCSSMVS